MMPVIMIVTGTDHPTVTGLYNGRIHTSRESTGIAALLPTANRLMLIRKHMLPGRFGLVLQDGMAINKFL